MPASGEILLRVRAVGVCGSDLHTYLDGRIGDTAYTSPVVLGHEFMGVIEAMGTDALDGNHQPLQTGQRVAVDPTTPCYHCELCAQGHPNLCPNHTFIGLYPQDGALQEHMLVHARNCFPIPDGISDGGGALLEPLGVALHAVDLSHLKVANSVAIIGCGPIGLLILQVAKLAGADPIYAFDKFPWRVEKARQYGVAAWQVDQVNPVEVVMAQTHKRGVDVVFEAAWADESVQLAAELSRYGGRLILVGIPGSDRLALKHSTARRKGLSLIMSRRMKHSYPRTIHLVEHGRIDLDSLISHTFPLQETPAAYAKNVAYEEGVHKIVIAV
jgi:L-iditol 2-dehydrogenase